MSKRYAICVGNNYPGTANELQGCVNDANDWTTLLSGAGYSTLTLFEAPASEVIVELNTVTSQMRWGDRLVFTYSGHGTWVPDTSGDEVDHRDEALYMGDGSLLTDDVLQECFARMPMGAGALFLPDSCFSGTVSRLARVSSTYRRTRFLNPATIGIVPNAAQAWTLERAVDATPIGVTASLISGCGESEYSYDAYFSGRYNGAFTAAAIKAYHPGISLNSWFKAIRAELPNDEYPQSPQLSPQNLYRKYIRAL